MHDQITEATAGKLLACLERIELMLARRLPRQAPRRNIATNAVPMAEIVAAFVECCPMLDRPAVLTTERRLMLRNLWRRYEKAEGGPLPAIRGLFEIVAESDFLTGRSPGSTFRADMWWVIEPNHMASIIEGRYNNRAMASNRR